MIHALTAFIFARPTWTLCSIFFDVKYIQKLQERLKLQANNDIIFLIGKAGKGAPWHGVIDFLMGNM